jgi:thiosulfate/3-mercaptopyruvate sulfurtransferase
MRYRNMMVEFEVTKEPEGTRIFYQEPKKHKSGTVVLDLPNGVKDQSKYLILDSRHNLDEFTGKQLLSGLNSPGKEITVARGGSIPNAVFSPWTKYAGNKNGDANKNTLKDVPELQKQLEKLKKNGYDASKTVITYCHIGLGRGSFQYLALKKAGHDKTKLYIGSWQEWGNNPSLPLGKSSAAE